MKTESELWEEALSYCWASPRGWDDSTPDKPRCNLIRGHDGQHIMHVEWRDAAELRDWRATEEGSIEDFMVLGSDEL